MVSMEGTPMNKLAHPLGGRFRNRAGPGPGRRKGGFGVLPGGPLQAAAPHARTRAHLNPNAP
jgi:hypothetical protein